MSQHDFFTYVCIVVVLILSGLQQFRGSRAIGSVIIIIAVLIALEVSLKLDWVHLPNIHP